MAAIRLHQLEGFFYVARTGGYTKAAEAFSYPIGQPAVYQQVKQLQEALGVTLVRQAGPRRTELTPEGRALFAFISPFFEGLPRVVEQLQGAAGEPLVLAADQFLAMEALAPALIAIRKKHPDFRVRVLELASQELVDSVLHGDADVGLLWLPATPVELRWQPLGRIGASLLVPADHPLAKLKKAPTPQDVARHPLIVHERRSPSRKLTERVFREYGSHLQIVAEVTFAETMRAMVRAGVAPAFVPHLISSGTASQTARGSSKETGTRTFDISSRLKGGGLPFGLLFRSGTEESATFKVFRDAMVKLWG